VSGFFGLIPNFVSVAAFGPRQLRGIKPDFRINRNAAVEPSLLFLFFPSFCALFAFAVKFLQKSYDFGKILVAKKVNADALTPSSTCIFHYLLLIYNK
jgi:hypothetical protein